MFELIKSLMNLTEGVKDLRSRYVDSKKVDSNVFSELENGDPSSTKKYLDWMLRQYLANPERQRHIIDVVKLFDQQVNRKKITGPESDINKYDLESADEISNRASVEKTKGDVKREISSSEADKVVETDKYVVISPKTHAASCKYGAGTRWCTTSKSPEYWDTYYKKSVKLYYILMKTGKKYAVAVAPNGKMESFDEMDKLISLDTVVKKTGVNKKIFKPISEKEFESRLIKYIESVCTRNDDGTYSSSKDVDLNHFNFKKFPVRFKVVGGDFFCGDNRLTSLDGAPQEVGGDFFCGDNQLTSLDGAPQKVGEGFSCDGNRLTSLDGAPQKVGGSFFCNNNQLTSLDGAPQEVGGVFSCGGNQLTSLDGAPQKVGGVFFCGGNRLTSLDGAPQEVGVSFFCNNNQLTSLDGAPQKVGKDFSCSGNRLTSLDGAPQKVGRDFFCNSNQLTSLDGAPQEVGRDFWCDGNRLTSLDGAPQEVGGDFSCNSNQLTSLDGAPQKVGKGFFCENNPVPSDKLEKTIKREYLK